MKKFALLLFVGLIGFASISTWKLFSGPGLIRQVQSSPEFVKSSSTPIPSAHPIYTPERVEIPQISVNAAVESVALDDKGNMDVPQDADNVGWYTLGGKLGQPGNSVFAGHFDKTTGEPAVFYSLSALKAGDEIIVHTKQGSPLYYTVQTNELYSFDAVPLQEIFGSSAEEKLQLITCDGVFDQTSNNYSKRRVVTAFRASKT